MPSQIEICFKFKIHPGTVLRCWRTECQKIITEGAFAYALRRIRSGLQRGLIWCEDCTKEYQKEQNEAKK
jgi:hypothetical protein